MRKIYDVAWPWMLRMVTGILDGVHYRDGACLPIMATPVLPYP